MIRKKKKKKKKEKKRKEEMLYLSTHSTPFIYGYMASEIKEVERLDIVCVCVNIIHVNGTVLPLQELLSFVN